MGSSNYNIWYLTQDALNENDNITDLPSVVCNHCLSEKYAVYFSVVTCKMCHDLMPSNLEPIVFKKVHSVVDTNYLQWPICNTCANQHWKTSMYCICGKVCHESDMLHLKSSKISKMVNKDSSSICWNVLNLIAPTPNGDDIVLIIDKLCKSCATSTGIPTFEGREAFKNLLDDSYWASNTFPLSVSNISHLNDVSPVDVTVYPSPSIITYIKNQNPGKIGYAVQYDQAF